jgi:diguanylate cyclase (GGDEF)-like protein
MSQASVAAQKALAPRDEDPLLRSAAHRGELTVARSRLRIILLILVIQLLPGWDRPVHRVGIAVSVLGLLWSLGIFWMVRRRYRPALGFIGTAVDVSLVSAALVGFAASGLPDVAVNSRVAFEVYFIAIGAASLRYDWRVPALAGVLAALQYTGVALFAEAVWGEGDPSFVSPGLNWNVVYARLVLLGAMTFLALAIVEKARRLRADSIYDRLTGLLSRAAFEDRLREEVGRARRSGRPFAVALLDVDLFQHVNEAHGHTSGDAVLQQIAGTLQRGVRQADSVARWGGQEFAFLLPETQTEGAVLQTERLRAAVAVEELAVGSSPHTVQLTVSIGVSSFPDDGTEPGDVLARADARLYEAKRLGRNRVVGPRPSGQPDPARSVDAPAPAKA